VLYGLYLVCFQQVYAQLPAVYLQHPFWGDVSFFSRCEAAFSNPIYNQICLEPQHKSQAPCGNLTFAIQEPGGTPSRPNNEVALVYIYDCFE